MCQMLGVQVQGSWKACQVAIPAFAPTWEGLERMILQDEKPALPTTHSQIRGSDTSCPQAEQVSSIVPERKQAKAMLA